ncbi:hypothetical protein [Streptomyces sp. UNOB3_S3]|uniref:hypothetical protein n=1 Tax=Streptomyces sp. UNOB3_S3 TaxID=2871682 RepID=UPI001E4FA7A3|nr:hypothetical protein [Streptomyces sp. UNOB3_S3]MCC3775301.1 hypothetical protein [Streptomyces sp. UNOB3_S3]
MRMLPRSHSRRPLPPRPAAITGTLHARCDRRVENKVRALCVIGLTGPGARLSSLHIVDPDDAVDVVVAVRLTFAADGPALVALERLVEQLSREPGVRDLHWRLDAPGEGGDLPPRR